MVAYITQQGGGGGGLSSADMVNAMKSVDLNSGNSIAAGATAFVDGVLWTNETGSAITIPATTTTAAMEGAGLTTAITPPAPGVRLGVVSALATAPTTRKNGSARQPGDWWYLDTVDGANKVGVYEWNGTANVFKRDDTDTSSPPRIATGNTTIANGEHVVMDNAAAATVTINSGVEHCEISRATTSVADVTVISADAPGTTVMGDPTGGVLNAAFGPTQFLKDAGNANNYIAVVPGATNSPASDPIAIADQTLSGNRVITLGLFKLVIDGLTGQFVFNTNGNLGFNASGAGYFNINTGTGGTSQIAAMSFVDNGKVRIQQGKLASGAWYVQQYSAAGVYVGRMLLSNPADARLTVTADPVAAKGIATKQYCDTIPVFTVATAPAANAVNSPRMIRVSDAAAGYGLYYSDEANWKRTTDDSILA